MDRRTLLNVFGAGLLAASIVARAQQTGKAARIGYLSTGTPTANAPLHKAFIDGLRDRGWIEKENIAIEYRWEEVGNSTLDALAVDLARLPLDAIFAANTPMALAMKRTGTTVPVVFAAVSEPVAIGLAASLARPGKNFTGLSTINRELMPKRLEVLKEAIPGLVRVGYLANPGYEAHRVQLAEMDAAARSFGMTLQLAEVRAASEFDGALAYLASSRVGAFIVQQDNLFNDNRAIVIDSANRRRLPGMYVFSFYPQSGGLMSYGADAKDLFRRAAGYMDKILRGAKPSELPIEQPTRFELVVNLRTAKTLGIAIPQSLLQRADRVIE